MGVAFEMATTAFVIIAPTLMYLGLLRGLEKLRDDELIARIEQHPDMERLDKDLPGVDREGATPLPSQPAESGNDENGEDEEYEF
jgi:hypothetical protein